MQSKHLLRSGLWRLMPVLLTCCILLACNNASEQSAADNDTSAAANNTDTGWQLIPFVKADSVNPILQADAGPVFNCPLQKKAVKWEEKDVFNPAAIVRNDTVFLLYRAEDKIGRHAGTSRIGIAYSTDGLHFTRHPVPVLYPDEDAHKKLEWEGGCEDPRIVQREDGQYILTYTAYDGDKARLMIASSPDLYHWTKHGHAFAKAYNGKYVSKWSKSGSIVSAYDKGNIVAQKINGKYWMYWGDVNIWAATSDDCINWTPVLYAEGEQPSIPLRHNAPEIAEVKIVFGPREKKFDSDLVEPGPAAMITGKGILLIYNSRNVQSMGDNALPEGTYAAGQILLDKADPMKVIQRSEDYFIKPDKKYEILGQVNHVCFVEGLVQYKGKWFLYYGTADSKIAVAVK
ncbi:MAG TPA: glycoside hydrolase family 130 protein [Chitinophagaceae bacterium]|nr:glycoside hydrolase family 130 protein [Chitinophagaceae bacterium]